ncbi:hypothetical protein H0H87_010842 [Tephrocybe sp. NHM501043]|nr:hypothetical protein H0H87_010842 [Tephrocybe sp. NHM501043]
MRLTGSIARLAGALVVLNTCVGSIAATLPSAVLFPLYIYPGDSCASWNTLFSSISTHTSLEFLVIVNPNSGPGDIASQPDANYQACVTKLRTTGASSGGNVKLLGYVRTGYASRAIADITAEIDTYANWAEAYRLEGIFFDEASTNGTLLSSYQTYVSHAKSAFGSSTYIALNPGVWNASSSSVDYFSIADLIVTFENTYDAFSVAAIPTGASTPTEKQAVIIHTGPTAVPVSTVETLTQTLAVGASFYSDFTAAQAYNTFPTDWTNYLDALVSTQASLL